MTKLLSWWYVLRLKGLSCRCGPAGQRTQHATTCRAHWQFIPLASLNLYPCSMPLPLCGVSLSRVETANRRFTCFLYIKHSFFSLSLCCASFFTCWFHLHRCGSGGRRWRLQRPSLDIGINKDVVLGQGRAEQGRADIGTDIYADFYFAAINFYAATTS